MKYLFAAAVLVAGTFASFSAANAAGGCGPGWYRGPDGGCQPIRRAVVVRACPSRRGASGSPRRRGTARRRMPVRHRVALRTLPRLLSLSKDLTKSLAHAGLFLLRRHDGHRHELRNHVEDRMTRARSKGRDCACHPCLHTTGLPVVAAAPVTATAAPVAAATAMPAPVPAATPAPTSAPPAPMPAAPAAMTAVAPAHFFRREAIDFIA